MQLTVNGFSMAYSDAGQGIPLLFVHGFPLNRRLWQPQLEGLSGVAQVLAPDLRGHGDSDPIAGPYSMDLLAGDLNAFLDALGIQEKIVLCGLSMGGYIAFAFCRKYAHRLRGLILTATRAAADTPEGLAARDQMMALARENGVAPIVETMLPKMLAPQTYQARPGLVEQVRIIMLRTSLEGVLGDLAALKSRPDSTPTLAQIAAPTLILHGAQDQLIPLKEAEAMRDAIPGARLVVIEQAGHLLGRENARMFNKAVKRFLDTLI
jgi:pimeloyl-ACP methyl ester carboxylesterase